MASEISVTIIGAGIGGLALAACLERAKISYTIYERNTEMRPLGSAIALGGVVVAMLRQLEVYDQLLAISKPILESQIYTESLNPIGKLDFRFIEERYGNGSIIVPRADLYRILSSLVPTNKVVFGHKLVSIVQTKQNVTGFFENDLSVTSDILIGADGAYSTVRRLMFENMQSQKRLVKSDTDPLSLSATILLGTTKSLDPELYPEIDMESSQMTVVLGDHKPYQWYLFTVPGNKICWMVSKDIKQKGRPNSILSSLKTNHNSVGYSKNISRSTTPIATSWGPILGVANGRPVTTYGYPSTAALSLSIGGYGGSPPNTSHGRHQTTGRNNHLGDGNVDKSNRFSLAPRMYLWSKKNLSSPEMMARNTCEEDKDEETSVKDTENRLNAFEVETTEAPCDPDRFLEITPTMAITKTATTSASPSSASSLFCSNSTHSGVASISSPLASDQESENTDRRSSGSTTVNNSDKEDGQEATTLPKPVQSVPCIKESELLQRIDNDALVQKNVQQQQQQQQQEREDAIIKDSEWSSGATLAMVNECRDFILPLGGRENWLGSGPSKSNDNSNNNTNNINKKRVTLGDLMDQTDPSAMSKVAQEEKLFETWFDGRVCLLGDSCHKMMPSAGQGANQCFLDALYLSSYLNELTNTSSVSIQSVFSRYRSDRYPIAREAVEASKMFNTLFSGKSKKDAMIRKLWLRGIPKFITTRMGARLIGQRPQLPFIKFVADNGRIRNQYMQIQSQRMEGVILSPRSKGDTIIGDIQNTIFFGQV